MKFTVNYIHKYIFRLLRKPVFVYVVFLLVSCGQNQNKTKAIFQNDELTLREKIDSLNIESRNLTFVNSIKSLELAQKALELSEGYETGRAYAYRNIANIYVLNEVYSLGAKFLKDAENIFEALNDSVGLADCYISYGHMYRGLHDVKNEILNFEKAFHFYETKTRPERLGICALNLAESYYDNQEFIKGRKLATTAIDLNTESNQLQVLSVCYNLMGQLELKENRMEEAKIYFLKVLDLSTNLAENSQKIATIEALIHLSEIYKNQGDKQKESGYLLQALDFALRDNLSTFILSVYNKLVLFHLNQNELNEAKNYLVEFNARSGSIHQKRMEDQTELVNNLLYAQNLENENKLLESTNQIQKKNLRIRNFLLIVIALFAVTLLVKWYDLNRANHKIRIQNEELQKRNELIIAQSRELSELLSNRDRLFSIIAHDLRNPFNSMLLTLEILSGNLENSTHEQIEKRILRLKSTAKSTYELLEKLLLWAKNQKENNAPNKVELNLFELAEEAYKPLQGSAQEKKVEFVNGIKSDLRIFADQDMMLTILRNLIQNALKFSRENGKVEITSEANSKLATICVTDYGVGMDQNTQQNIFTFETTKIRNGTSGEKGSGLGLVLCKQFVEKNNGEIWVDSALEKGTKVYFTVPVVSKIFV